MNKGLLRAGAFLLVELLALCAPASAAGIFSMISGSEQLTAVNSKEYNGYVRAEHADGSFQNETYSFGEGGEVPPPAVPGFVIYDPTIDGVKFSAIARMIAEPLAEQNYSPSRDPDATKLLIMVYWGRNVGHNAIWEFDGYNARLLGFDSDNVFELSLTPATPFMPGYGRSFRSELIEKTDDDVTDALRVDRYFVILRAYDFQTAWKQRKLKLLWDTRFSLSERRHDFEKDLPSMAHTASLFFGQDSHGLVQIPPVPDGHVYIGNIKTLDDQADNGSARDDGLSSVTGDWQGIIPGFPPVFLHIDKGGNSTFGIPRQHAALPARVSVKAGALTVTVPGWDVLFRGTVEGDRIKGTLSEYSKSGQVMLTRISDH
jgi:hypothetical protein